MRNDRGVIPVLGVILAGIFVVTATVVTIVVVKQNQGANPSGFTIAVNSASAARNDAGNPVVTVVYTVDYGSDAAAAALVTPPSVRCTIAQKQLTQRRAFSGEEQVVGTTRIATGSLAVVPGEANRSVGGAFGVVCELLRDGAVLDTATGPDVTIAEPTGPPESSAPATEPPTTTSTELPDVIPFAGRYVAPFTRITGDESNCTLQDNFTVAAEAQSRTSLKIAFDGADIYSGPLTPDLRFTTSVGLFPGHPDYYGQLTAQFSVATRAHLKMTIVTTSPACTLVFDVDQG